MKNNIIIVVLILFSFSFLGAKATDTKKKPVDKDQPIEIVSDRLDAYNEKKLVIFSGNAVATQGDKVIKSNRLLLYYKKGPQTSQKASSKDMSSTGDLEKIEADGNVIVTQGERIVTGNFATYYQDTQKIIMTGNAVMREGRNIIRGDRIVVYLDEDWGIVEGDKNSRVKATIYPEDRKDKKN